MFMNLKETRPGLSGSSLKILAIATMFLDHIGAVILEPLLQSSIIGSREWMPVDLVLRLIGRIAFPIFAFLLVEGFLHTSDRKRYGIRLFLFALISEIPFDLAFQGRILEFTYQNVFFTLLIGYVVIWGMEKTESGNWMKLPMVLLGMWAAAVIRSDYSFYGVFLIAVLYFFHGRRKYQCIFGSLALLWELPAVLAFLPISHYNGARGKNIKYFFYFFYPVHLLILTGIRFILYGI